MNTRNRITRLILLTITLFILFTACRRQESPTPIPPTPLPTQPVITNLPTPPITPSPIPHIEIDWQPQVVYNSPAPGEETLLDGAITIRFDQPMNQSSVEAAFAIADESGQPVDGVFTWAQEDTVVFTPAGKLARQSKYLVKISDSAEGINGQPLRQPVEMALETVGYLQVSQILPSDGSTEMATDTAITVVFNRPVVPVVATSQQGELPNPLQIEPAINGTGQWISSSIYRFVPDEPLAGATNYQIAVMAGLTDVTGALLAETVNSQFTTASPMVLMVQPVLDATQVIPTKPITVTFNMPMDRESTEGAIALSPAADVQFNWLDGDKMLAVVPASAFNLSTTYTIAVAQTARSANGAATLSSPFSSNFTTVPFPSVVETNPQNGTLADPYQRGGYIRFASPMDFATLENQILIEPAPKRVSYYYNDYDFSVYLDFDPFRNTRYTITVPGTAADPYGNTIGKAYSFSYTTPPYAPMASLNLPEPVSQLSTSYPTAVDIVYRNVSQVNGVLYDLELNVPILINPYNSFEFNPGNNVIGSWSQPVSAPLDVAASYNQPLAGGGTLPTGVYWLTISAPEVSLDYQYWQNQSQLLVVADTNLVVKEMYDRVYVWATNLATGQPAANLTVYLYDNAGTLRGEATTDSNGFVDLDYTPLENYLAGVLVISSKPGEAGFGVANSSWNFTASPWDFGLAYDSSREPTPFGYLYTDRPIYRPGDTVYFKGILRQPNFGRYGLPAISTAEMLIQNNVDYNQSGIYQSVEVKENGTFEGAYTIPATASLGPYGLSLSFPNGYVFGGFTVAQYRKPEFLVEVLPAQTESLRGQEVEVVIKAEYLFGAPAADLSVNWSVTSQNYALNWEGAYYSFDSSGSDVYINNPLGGGYYGRYLMGGTSYTNAQGEVVITLPADLLEQEGIPSGSQEVTIEVTVQPESGVPVAARSSVVFHAAELYVGVVPANYIANAGTSTSVNLITINWDNQPVPNSAIDLIFYRREWQSSRSTQFGNYYTEWIPIDSEVARASVISDNRGEAVASFTPEEGGTYFVVATVTDASGQQNSSQTYLWIADPAFADWRSAPRERRMDISIDKPEYAVGDTAQLLVQSPFTGPVYAWLTIERGNLIEQQLITLQNSSQLLEIPITDIFAPNVYVTVVAVKGIDAGNAYADLRLGIVELKVNPERLALNIELTPRQTVLQPRETAIYDVLVTDYAGTPISADLSLSLVDLAVLTLLPDNSPNILEAFYPRQPFRSQYGSGLFTSGEGLEIEIPNEFLGGGGGGGGGELSGITARLDEDEDAEDIRKDFRDTAYWSASLQTDTNGQATVEIPLPDNLTTWRLTAKGVTENSLVGQSYVDVVSQKPLLIRPATPRFFTVGDEIQLAANIYNNTTNAINTTISLEATGLEILGNPTQILDIPGQSNTLVRWQVVVQDVEWADLTFRAVGDGGGVEYVDATKPTFGVAPDQLLPVYRYDAQDVVGTSGTLDDPGRVVEAFLLPPGVDSRQGSVNLSLSPSLAASLLDTLRAFDYLPADNMRCAGNIIDQLLPNLATAQALQALDLSDEELSARLEALIGTSLTALEQLQKEDGGWGWCYETESNAYLAAYVLWGLGQAQEAGFGVNSQVLSAGIAYVQSQLPPTDRLANNGDANRQAFFLYVLAKQGENVAAQLDQLFTQKRELLDPYARALLILTYHRLGTGQANIETLIADLNNSVIISATGSHWEDTTPDRYNLSTDIRSTAIILDALSQVQPTNPTAERAVRWLMAARRGNSWYVGQENVWAVLALTDWMVATSELNANYRYGVLFNTQLLDLGEFTPQTVTQAKTYEIPLSTLWADRTNYLFFDKGEGEGRLYYTAHLDSFIDANAVSAVSRGVTVQRTYYDAACQPTIELPCPPITSIKAGQSVRVTLTVIVPHDLTYVLLEDHFPSGAEAVDPNLLISRSDTGATFTDLESQPGQFWGWWHFERIEYRDDRVQFYGTFLPAGTYQYTYTLNTILPGSYQVMPALAQEVFFPEVFGRSDGLVFEITQ